MEALKRAAILLALLMASGCTFDENVASPWGLPISATDVRLDLRASVLEWSDASARVGEFEIELPDGPQKYPFTWAGSVNSSAIRFYLEIENVGPNPFSNETTWYGYGVGLYLSNDEDTLTPPADLKVFSQLSRRFNASFTDDGYFDGRLWQLQDEGPKAEFDGDGRVLAGTAGRGATNGTTMWWEIVIVRSASLTEHDGVLFAGSKTVRAMLEFYVSDGELSRLNDPSESLFGTWHDTYPSGARDSSAEGWLRVELPA